MKSLVLCFIFIFVDSISTYDFVEYPHRSVMFRGYYSHPQNSRGYIPQGLMTFAAGDTIATNSFVRDLPLDSSEETTEKRRINHNIDDVVIDVEASTVNVRSNRTPPPKKNENDEDETPWPFAGHNKERPSYMSFFPMMFGGSPGSKTRSSDEFYPGSATAIANSFSTGKGGVATSHATSFGDPSLSTLFRSNFPKKLPKPIPVED